APGAGSGGGRSVPAHIARTGQTDPICLPTRETDPAPPRPGWGAAPAPARPSPTADPPAAVRALNRHHVDLKARQRRAQRAHTVLVMHEPRRQQLLTARILNQHIVLL